MPISNAITSLRDRPLYGERTSGAMVERDVADLNADSFFSTYARVSYEVLKSADGINSEVIRFS